MHRFPLLFECVRVFSRVVRCYDKFRASQCLSTIQYNPSAYVHPASGHKVPGEIRNWRVLPLATSVGVKIQTKPYSITTSSGVLSTFGEILLATSTTVLPGLRTRPDQPIPRNVCTSIKGHIGRFWPVFGGLDWSWVIPSTTFVGIIKSSIIACFHTQPNL